MGKKRKKAKGIKAGRKQLVALPVDRTSEPIHVGDVLKWGDSERMQVSSLTYYGEWDVPGCSSWTAENDDGGFSDNLEAALIVWRGKEGKR